MKEHRLGKFNYITLILKYFFSIVLLILSILPFWILFVNATRSTEQIQQSFSMIPSRFLIHNYEILISKGFNIARGFLNSFTISSLTTFLGLYFSALTAYGLVIYEFKIKKFITGVIGFILMLPTQISMIGFYQMMLKVNLTDNYIPLIVPAIASPATVFFMRQYLLSNFPKELVQAARIDGSKEIYTFHRIALPLLKPALATMGLFSFVMSWNNFLMPLMLITSEKKFTLPMLVQLLKADIYRTEYGSIYFGVAITVIPLIIVYTIFSKYIIAGVALGGIKE